MQEWKLQPGRGRGDFFFFQHVLSQPWPVAMNMQFGIWDRFQMVTLVRLGVSSNWVCTGHTDIFRLPIFSGCMLTCVFQRPMQQGNCAARTHTRTHTHTHTHTQLDGHVGSASKISPFLDRFRNNDATEFGTPTPPYPHSPHTDTHAHTLTYSWWPRLPPPPPTSPPPPQHYKHTCTQGAHNAPAN